MSVEHQYDVIKDDGPDLNAFSNGCPCEANDDILHTDHSKSKQFDHIKGISQRGTCY